MGSGWTELARTDLYSISFLFFSFLAVTWVFYLFIFYTKTNNSPSNKQHLLNAPLDPNLTVFFSNSIFFKEKVGSFGPF